jgi:ferredoxin
VRIEADKDLCIGAGNCVLSTDVIFDQDEDGVVVLRTEEVPPGEEERAREAVELCPSSALKLVDD